MNNLEEHLKQLQEKFDEEKGKVGEESDFVKNIDEAHNIAESHMNRLWLAHIDELWSNTFFLSSYLFQKGLIALGKITYSNNKKQYSLNNN